VAGRGGASADGGDALRAAQAAADKVTQTRKIKLFTSQNSERGNPQPKPRILDVNWVWSRRIE